MNKTMFVSSDFHIEMSGVIPDTPEAHFGIFAGDIGLINEIDHLIEFFEVMKTRYKHVIYCLGNHEFYHMDYNTALIQAKEMCDDLDVHLLSTELGTQDLELDGVTFFGDTLWTNFNDHDYFAEMAVEHGLNDFRVIRNGDNILSVEDVTAMNKKARNAINYNADVIITHHAPIVVPHPHFDFEDISWGFYNSGLEEQIINSNVKVWMYGHTHHSADFDLAGTRIIANCHGFVSRYSMSEGSGYDPDLIIEI